MPKYLREFYDVLHTTGLIKSTMTLIYIYAQEDIV